VSGGRAKKGLKRGYACYLPACSIFDGLGPCPLSGQGISLLGLGASHSPQNNKITFGWLVKKKKIRGVQVRIR
jgi:hypothetical protein